MKLSSDQEKQLIRAANKQLSRFEERAPKEFILGKIKDNRYIHILRVGKNGKKDKEIGSLEYEIVFTFSDANRSKRGKRIPIKDLADDDIREAIEGMP